MIKKSGHADLPLHSGTVPKWLADRMKQMGTLICESIILNYGPDEVLVRLSDPLWFQSFGAALGMDWHSSGITTSVMYALKRGLNERFDDFGLYICGGRGKFSRKTPEELLYIAEKTSLNGENLVNESRLCAKIDNNAVQDGFSLYQHNFIISKNGNWTVVQQGMNTDTKTARRYHWCNKNLRSFVENPHTGVVGNNNGKILNLTDENAKNTRSKILELSLEKPETTLNEILKINKPASEMILFSEGQVQKINNTCEEKIFYQADLFEEQSRSIIMPRRHNVLAEDVDLQRLGGVLAAAYLNQPQTFESLMLTKGLGPRTLQSLTLVSELIYGTPSRFTDPARFSFAHGGKDGQPFPVPIKIYDESINILQDSIEKSKLGYKEKSECIKRLHETALEIEKKCNPTVDFDKAIQYEKSNSQAWGGKTI